MRAPREDVELCERLNESRPAGWEAFEPLGDGVQVQAYREARDYGVIGGQGRWQVVFAADGVPALGADRCPTLDHAFDAVAILARADEITAAERKGDE